MQRSTPQSNSEWVSQRVAVLLMLLAISCGLAAGQNDKPRAELSGAGLFRAPAVATSWTNPYAGQEKAVRAGKKLFEHHCAECHGQGGQGSERAPRLAVSAVRDAPPGVLFWFVKNGDLKEGMPAWSRLPDERIWQLVSYLQTLAPHDEAAEKVGHAPRP